jgi:hypothetical protein
VWSGQGPDPKEWYQSFRFWRWAPLFVIIALCGGLMIGQRKATVPGTDAEFTGWGAVLIGLVFLFVGGGALGLLIAVVKRED